MDSRNKLTNQKPPTTLQLIKAYENIAVKIAEKFAKKQGMEIDEWLSPTVVWLGDYVFNIEDIILDLKTKQKKGLILQWQNESMIYAMKGYELDRINYASYIKGLRYDHLEQQKGLR